MVVGVLPLLLFLWQGVLISWTLIQGISWNVYRLFSIIWATAPIGAFPGGCYRKLSDGSPVFICWVFATCDPCINIKMVVVSQDLQPLSKTIA
jgi:hypothetical protein